MPSNMMNIEIRIRNMPFAKPESVSILPYLMIMEIILESVQRMMGSN